MGNQPHGSQIFRLPRQDSIRRKVSIHLSRLLTGMTKLHHMAMIQMLLLRKRTVMGVRPLLLGNITVGTKSRNLLSIPHKIA